MKREEADDLVKHILDANELIIPELFIEIYEGEGNTEALLFEHVNEFGYREEYTMSYLRKLRDTQKWKKSNHDT